VMIELDAARAAKILGDRPSNLRLERPNPGGSPPAASPPLEPPRAAPSRFGLGQVAGRVLRGEMDEAGAEAIGAGLSSLYRQLDQMGFQSGREFVVAVEEAEALGATLLLGDRDAKQTLRRLRDALVEVMASPRDSVGPPPDALVNAAGSQDFTRDNVLSTMAVLKQRETVRELTAYLKAEVPPFYNALIGERDAYMASTLLNSDGRRLVAVVGLAHVDGIEANILRQAGSRPLPGPAQCAPS
jgi:pheromone shutdown protein TraB